jgi:glycosyltransferase involved in cell wall biosynthesis
MMAASYRMLAWAKYLPAFGWHPIILTHRTGSSPMQLNTVQAKGGEAEINHPVYRVPFKQSFIKLWDLRESLLAKVYPYKADVVVRRTLSFILRNFLLIPDEKIGWYTNAYQVGLEIIKKRPVQAILSTGGPWTDFKIASDLSRAAGVPWVADYRDPWTQWTTLGVKKEYLIWYLINRIYELKIVRTASACIHITEALRQGLSQLLKRKVHLIRNGFDPEHFNTQPKPQPSSEAFTLSFIGTLHSHTDTDVFFEGFSKFIKERNISPDLCRIEFIGDTYGHKRIEKSFAGFPQMKKFVHYRQSVSQTEANAMMCRSHILLLFPLDMAGCCPAKTYEYLASGRPILVTPIGLHRGEIRKILERTRGGKIFGTPEEVAGWIAGKFDEFLKTGHVKSTTDLSTLGDYNRKNQVQYLARILDATIAGPE